MGYRSEVAFCLQVKEPEKFIALAKLKADDVLTEMLDNMYYVVYGDDNPTKYILFTHNYWKWYDESQQAFRELMKMAEDYDEYFTCRFARVGEELDDTEEEAHGECGWDLDFPYVTRGIDIGARTDKLNKVIKEEDHATTS